MQLMVAPLQKLTPKANATIKDVGTIDSLVQSFGPYITGMSLSAVGALCCDPCVSDRKAFFGHIFYQLQSAVWVVLSLSASKHKASCSLRGYLAGRYKP